MIKIVFFGTPEYVVPILNSLHKAFRGKKGSPITAVVTQKPKPTGRKKILTYSPVDSWAHQKKLPIFYDEQKLMENKVKADIAIVAAYGKIIQEKTIKYFPHGILNIHPSLLPKLRGASPVQATIISGETPGVTITKMDEKMDHGPIISQFKDELKPNDTTGSLRKRLFSRSSEVLNTLIPAYIKGGLKLKPQNHKEASFTTLLVKNHGFIPWKYLTTAVNNQTLKKKWIIPFIKNYTTHYSPITIHRFIRAMQPWPGAWTFVETNTKQKTKAKKRLRILKSHLHHTPSTKRKSLVLDTVQLEGKNPVSWKQFCEAYLNAFHP